MLIAPEMRMAAAAAQTPWIGVMNSMMIHTAAKRATRRAVYTRIASAVPPRPFVTPQRYAEVAHPMGAGVRPRLGS